MINLNTPLGKFSKKGIITDIKIDKVEIPGKGIKEKVCLLVDRGGGNIIKINEAYVEDFKGAKKQQGFWLTEDEKNNISCLSTIGRFMDANNANTLKELIGKEINLFIGKRNLLITGL